MRAVEKLSEFIIGLNKGLCTLACVARLCEFHQDCHKVVFPLEVAEKYHTAGTPEILVSNKVESPYV